MARIPAICKNCGLIFPSGVQAMSGLTISEATSECPRCRSKAPIPNGYTAIINGMVAFIVSPEYSIGEKQLLIDTAAAVSRNEMGAAEAARTLDASNRESGRLFREWADLGLKFVACMATVAAAVLAYFALGGNADPVEVAMEKVDEVIETLEQPNLRFTFPNIAEPISTLPFSLGRNSPQDGGNVDKTTTKPHAPNENRKARRSAISKERQTKGRK